MAIPAAMSAEVIEAGIGAALAGLLSEIEEAKGRLRRTKAPSEPAEVPDLTHGGMDEVLFPVRF